MLQKYLFILFTTTVKKYLRLIIDLKYTTIILWIVCCAARAHFTQFKSLQKQFYKTTNGRNMLFQHYTVYSYRVFLLSKNMCQDFLY